MSDDSGYATEPVTKDDLVIKSRYGNFDTTLNIVPNPVIPYYYKGGPISFDSTSTYMTMTSEDTNIIAAYKRNNDTFTSANFAIDIPSNMKSGRILFDPTGTYLAIHVYEYDSTLADNHNYVYIYKRNGDTFTKIYNITFLAAPLNGNGVRGMAFDPTGTYLAISHTDTPYITICKRTGDTFIKLSNPAQLPTSGSYGGIAVDPTGMYVVVLAYEGLSMYIYKRNGDTFTRLPNPATLPSGSGYGAAFDPTGTYMVVTSENPAIIIYKRNGDTFTKLANPATLPSGSGYDVAFDPTGTYLAVRSFGNPYFAIYKRNGDTFTKLANPATMPSTRGNVIFDPTGTYLVVTNAYTPYLIIYRTASKNVVSPVSRTSANPLWWLPQGEIGIATNSGNKDDLIQISKLNKFNNYI